MTTTPAATKKKALHAAERDPERVRPLRTTCREPGQALDVSRRKVVAESGAPRARTRRDGRATPGQRVVESVPDHSGTHHPMLAAVSRAGRDAPGVVDGAVNGAIFHCGVRAIRCPTRRPGDLVLWENLSAHTVAGVEGLSTARGARLLPWSPYAPDFNPIEHCWSKSKTWRRRAKARTVEALIEAIKDALDTVTTADIRGWFAHCGYPVH
jgi:transposase